VYLGEKKKLKTLLLDIDDTIVTSKTGDPAAM
jgi:CTD small phosphatase-like protein 2